MMQKLQKLQKGRGLNPTERRTLAFGPHGAPLQCTLAHAPAEGGGEDLGREVERGQRLRALS